MQTIAADIPSMQMAIGAGSNQQKSANNGAPGMLKRVLINWAIKCNIFWLSIMWLRNPRTIWKVYRHMIKTRDAIWCGPMKKSV